MRVLAFDVYGKFAHFRKYWTTTSPLTFAFPPPPAVAGMLGVICGFPRPKHLEVFNLEKCRIGIGILRPVVKVRFGKNYLNTKFFQVKKETKESLRMPLKVEVVKNPRYRIYIFHEDEKVFKRLVQNLKERQPVFSLYLGCSEFLADFDFVGVFEVRKKERVEGEVVTVVGVDNLQEKKLKVQKENKYLLEESVPTVMLPNRIVKKYEDVIYDVNGSKVRGTFKEAYELESGEWICLF